MPLSDKTIRNAKPSDRPWKLSDERGLYLLVNPSGSKLWRFKYRFGGKEKLLALGSYPDVPLATPKGSTRIKGARDLRDDARKLLAAGIDPGALRREEKELAAGAGTFGALADAWYAHQHSAWTEGHAVTVRSRLDRDVLPYLASRPLEEIDAPEILKLVRRVESRGALETAHRILTITSQIFGFAVATDACKVNPAAGIDRSVALKSPTAKPMAAVLSSKEFAALLRAIDDYQGTHVVSAAHSSWLRWCSFAPASFAPRNGRSLI